MNGHHDPNLSDVWKKIGELTTSVNIMAVANGKLETRVAEFQGDVAELKEIMSKMIDQSQDQYIATNGFGTRIIVLERWRDEWEKEQRIRQGRIFVAFIGIAIPAVIGGATALTKLAFWAIGAGFKP